MFLAAPLAWTAVTVGASWVAKNLIINNSSKNWEEKVEFYDYVKGKIPIYKVLQCNNGLIVSVKIFHKDVSGSFSTALAGAIPFNHYTMVMKTDVEEFWSVEKNEKMINIQKSNNLNDITMWLNRCSRDKPLQHSTYAEERFLERYKIKWELFNDIPYKNIQINDILKYINEEERTIKFSYVNNCQNFIQRILNFCQNIPKTYIISYNYSTKELFINKNIKSQFLKNFFISKIKLLRIKSNGEPYKYIGFFMEMEEMYVTIEKNEGLICIQQAYDKGACLDKLNGIGRNKCLSVEVNERSMKINMKKWSINLYTILAIAVNKNTINGTCEEFVEKVLNLYNISHFFSHTSHSIIKFEDFFHNLSSTVYICNVFIWFKTNKEKNIEDAFYDKCLVLILKASDDEICLQSSDQDKILTFMLNERKRLYPLYQEGLSIYEHNANFQLRKLFQFLMNFQIKLFKDSSLELINETLQYLKVDINLK